NAVARIRPERVIYIFEVIKVENHHANHMAVPLALADFFGKSLLEKSAVSDTRQPVRRGKRFQPRLAIAARMEGEAERIGDCADLIMGLRNMHVSRTIRRCIIPQRLDWRHD